MIKDIYAHAKDLKRRIKNKRALRKKRIAEGDGVAVAASYSFGK